MHVTDNLGLTPLNAAILFNEPELVSFLISKGSDPKKIIRSPKQYLNGLNSYQLLELLINKDKATNRDSIHKMLIKNMHYKAKQHSRCAPWTALPLLAVLNVRVPPIL